MSVDHLHRALRERRHHLSPFFVLGDPSPEVSVEIAGTALGAGATMFELGLPFEAPSGDGPAIQRACRRARRHGISTPQALALLGRIHGRWPDVPLNLLVYGNLVHAAGYRPFCAAAAAAGASTMLVPDIPLEEGGPLRDACAGAGLGVTMLAGPHTRPARLRALASVATGFVYLAGHQGVTGRAGNSAARNAAVRRAGLSIDVPVCVGFGLTRASDVQSCFAAGARIAVVGSTLARLLEAAPADPAAAVGAACRALLAAPTAPRGYT